MKWGKTLLALASAAFLVAVMAYFAGVFHTDAEHTAKAASDIIAMTRWVAATCL